jgi:hypothetical protein
MNFGSGGNTEAKAWKDIWGSGQGIGSISEVKSVGDYVDQLEREYLAAKAGSGREERFLHRLAQLIRPCPPQTGPAHGRQSLTGRP